jgi:hypothetical protein
MLSVRIIADTRASADTGFLPRDMSRLHLHRLGSVWVQLRRHDQHLRVRLSWMLSVRIIADTRASSHACASSQASVNRSI